MASLTVLDMYYMRACAKLSLPASVQENIARLRITPMTYKPFHKPPTYHHRQKTVAVLAENWREKTLIDCVRRVKEREDPEYCDIFAILNKVTASSCEKLSSDAVALIKKRDEVFRLRVAILLFDKAITQHAYASVMADCAKYITTEIPDMQDDLKAQISMFPKLYNVNDTLTFPASADSEFNNKVIEWMKQKEKRRGYAKFMMELSTRGLVTEEAVLAGLCDVVNELKEVVKQPRTSQTEENVGQFAVFLFETAKLAQKSEVFKSFINDQIKMVLNEKKEDIPSLNMKSRFKLEDALKCVQ